MEVLLPASVQPVVVTNILAYSSTIVPTDVSPHFNADNFNTDNYTDSNTDSRLSTVANTNNLSRTSGVSSLCPNRHSCD